MASPVGPRWAVAQPGTAPAAPTITSTGKNVYVSGVAHNTVGTPGEFTFSDPGSTITGFYYGFSDTSTYIPVGPDGTATVTITPDDEEVLSLDVAAVDLPAGQGPYSTFDIETVSAHHINQLAWWPLNRGRGRSAADATGHGHSAKLSRGASLGCPKPAAPDRYRCFLNVTRRGGQAVATSPSVLPMVTVRSSFALSAWANVSSCAATCVAASEDAGQNYAFALSYRHKCHGAARTGSCWRFSMPDSQPGGPVFVAASIPGSARTGKWVQLTGVFNASHGIMTLYVNGAQAAQASAPPGLSYPSATFRLGNLGPVRTDNTWHGELSNICVFYGDLQPSDVKVLYTGNAAHPRNGCAALHGVYP